MGANDEKHTVNPMTTSKESPDHVTTFFQFHSPLCQKISFFFFFCYCSKTELNLCLLSSLHYEIWILGQILLNWCDGFTILHTTFGHVRQEELWSSSTYFLCEIVFQACWNAHLFCMAASFQLTAWHKLCFQWFNICMHIKYSEIPSDRSCFFTRLCWIRVKKKKRKKRNRNNTFWTNCFKITHFILLHFFISFYFF